MRVAVIGAGVNGLTAAAFFAREGIEVDVFERADVVGGACVTADWEDARIDLGAAAHPFGVASPAFRALRLEDHGLCWAHPEIPLAHPLDGASAACLLPGLDATAARLDDAGPAWSRLHRHLVDHVDDHLANILAPPLRVPAHPLAMARFAATGILPATLLARQLGEAGGALLMGSAAHAAAPLTQPLTGAFGLVFGALGMTRGWPVARGGSGEITRALARVVEHHGGCIHLGREVRSLAELDADAVVLNLPPRRVLELAGEHLARPTRRRMERWRTGLATHKLDWRLTGPIPWADPDVARAGTVHLGGIPAEIADAEARAARGEMPDRPFVILVQPGAADPTRAQARVAWATVHVPKGYVEPRPGHVRSLVEAQVERFAPGFGEHIVATRETSLAAIEEWNPAMPDGDIAAGAMTGRQTLLRPGLTLSPHTLARRRIFLASGATSPGAGVHGMPGLWAAQAVIRGARTRVPRWATRSRVAARR